MWRFLRLCKPTLPPLPAPLRAVPRPALRLILILVLVNLLVWAAVAPVLHLRAALISPAVLSYTLGLRHGLDADHIAAIDLTTRRLIAAGQRPVAVGTFFGLGHSAVVVATCVVVAATSGALRDRFDGFQRVGAIVGTSVSAAFLLVLCAANAWVLATLTGRLRQALEEEGQRGQGRSRREGSSNTPSAAAGAEEEGHVGDDDGEDGAAAGPVGALQREGAGCKTRVFRTMFHFIDSPWKIFPLGIMFGLGFDTSSEIAILGLASVEGGKGTSIWLILVFPILFTAGMCLVDTTDGALMMALYTSKVFSRDVVAILYYSLVLTGMTVLVSAFIGIIQVLSLVQNVADPEGPFWDGVSAIGDNFEIIGGSICGLFLVVGLGSVMVYRPWRRRMERRSTSSPGKKTRAPTGWPQATEA